ACDLLKEHYNPRCRPPWLDAELLHKCADASSKPFDKPRGWLLADAREIGEVSSTNTGGTGSPPPRSPATPVGARIRPPLPYVPFPMASLPPGLREFVRKASDDLD